MFSSLLDGGAHSGYDDMIIVDDGGRLSLCSAAVADWHDVVSVE